MSDVPTISDVTTASRPPSVLQLVPALDRGGIARAAIDTAAALVAAGGKALIAGGGQAMAGELRRLKITHLDVALDADGLVAAYAGLRRLREAMAGREIDILHARSPATAWMARRLAREHGRRYVATAHAPSGAGAWTHRWLDEAQAAADRVIAVSDHVAHDLRQRHRLPEARLLTIRPGIHLDRFDPATVRPDRVIRLATQWRLPDDRRIVLFPARLSEDRGQARLVDALRELDRDDVHCLFVGGETPATAFERRLQALIEAKGLGGRAAIASYCEDMPAAYMLADVVVAGGDGEGFSRVIAEAQAMGRPAVCDAAGGAVEAMVAQVTGWSAPPGVASALARSLERALSLDAEARAQLASRARAHIRERFSVERMGRETVALYADMMAVP
ncbi:MAG: glycosyltransferase [Alphaproteobacteria bacterium]|nr:glycosyltransferase [Alphaproteobacteria bacterium]MCW5740722.1 glycosyltransferase [Alphaproteobacteria bacterium]